MTRETQGFLTLYERGGAVATYTTDAEEYLAHAAALPALASPSPLWEAPDFVIWGATADIGEASLTLTGQSMLVDPIADMQTEIIQLKQRVAALEDELKALKASYGEGEEAVVVIRTVSREQAKAEIRALFATGETLYYSDIVHRLGLDISLVVELCKELEAEGEVSTLDDVP